MKKINNDFLSAASLEWAMNHITKFGDTDIFPVPFEYIAIKNRWVSIKQHLETLDFAEYQPKNTFNLLVPKKNGYRVARQLDPIDNIMMLAAIHEIAPILEKSRSEDTVACSYRIEIDSENFKMYRDDGWKMFYQISQKLAKKNKHVLTLDIADFYNQIYLHGVHNQLESAGVNIVRATSIENFLINLNAKKSVGLPVGPVFSIILAEMVLNDLDYFIKQLGFDYVRYVDDIRIFCGNSNQAERILHDVSEYLYSSLRLTLQTHKVKKLTTKKFLESNLYDPEEKKEEKYLDALKEKVTETGYGATEEDIEDEHGFELESESLQQVFDHCLSLSSHEIGYFKALLRLATKGRIRSILDTVLTNLELLMPVYRDVIKYLLAVENDGCKNKIEAAVLGIMKMGCYKKLPYQRAWSHYYYFSPKQRFDASDQFEAVKQVSKRDFMLLLAEHGKDHKALFMPYKENWQNFSAPERRAIIYASKILPTTERKIWLKNVEASTGDFFEKEIARYMLSFQG
ncbi:MAG: hypothetical protein A2X86_00450 [Bdellovibrionales bacterium GWA2_49_15]|nr:MAG: hypothetical protein A2X86_00450 [Bdellovibrionales bacterium GWA2_49_15]HAZ13264.1 hypothetical protein [Bdellovibrionales bacterium]